jgi:hypothetical protein
MISVNQFGNDEVECIALREAMQGTKVQDGKA